MWLLLECTKGFRGREMNSLSVYAQALWLEVELVQVRKRPPGPGQWPDRPFLKEGLAGP